MSETTLFAEPIIDHAARNARCGASDAAAILGLSPYRTPWECWAQKTNRLEPSKGNEATGMGQRLEAPILDYAEAELGPLVRGELAWAPRLEFPLASTLDARLKMTGIPVEAKTSGIVGPLYGEWGEPDSDVVPANYLVQVTLQMVCTEAEFAYLYALLGGRGIVRYRIVRDEELAAALVQQLAAWWDAHIVRDIEPERTSPVPLEVVKRLKKTPNKVVAFDDSVSPIIGEYEVAKAEKSAAEKRADAAQASLLMLLGDAEAATLPDGRMLTYLEQTRKGYVVKDSSFRVMRFRKGE